MLYSPIAGEVKNAMKMPRMVAIRNNPKVSIVMTVYNHEEFVSEAIESVLRLSFEDYEFIIINDGSTDNTASVLKKYRDYKNILIEDVPHRGRARALNLGFKLSRGKYIAIQDSDDIYLPSKIQKQVEFLDNHKGIVMVGSNSIVQDNINGNTYTHIPPGNPDEIKKQLLYRVVFHFPSIMTRRSILREVGFCNENLRVLIDFELFGKIASKGDITKIPETLIIIRRHQKNNFKTLDPELFRRTILKIRWMNLWRLKPNFSLFVRMLTWHAFEYTVNLYPKEFRRLIPNDLRKSFKRTKLIHPNSFFGSIDSSSFKR